MRQIVVAVAVTSLLAACMGDGTVFVTGQLRSETGMALQNCRLQLLAPSGTQIYDTSEIDPTGFSQDFVVAPREEEYPLAVSCTDHEPYRSSVRYVPGNSRPNTTALGTITLQVQRHGT